MKEIGDFFAAKPARRYVALILAVILAGVLSWIGFILGDAPVYRAVVPLLAYLLATPVWIVFAVRDRRKLIWRLLLVWAPALLPVAQVVSIAIVGDSTGLAYLFAMLLIFIFGAACLLGSFATLVYRPGDESMVKADREAQAPGTLG